LSDRLRIFLRICEPVAFAHAHGVLHRDLKPTNVMGGPFGEVRVMDWGLSKLLASAASSGEQPCASQNSASFAVPANDTAHGSVLGTPGYMAPEQKDGETALDQRADIYSLGAILEFLLHGAHPQPPPRALAAICRKAMEEDRSQRYASVPDLSEDVAHLLDGLAVSAYPEGPFGRTWRWIRRNRTWILLLLAYVITRALLIFLRPR
jgi:eukaryotic-like serine/threonine-protein kinase